MPERMTFMTMKVRPWFVTAAIALPLLILYMISSTAIVQSRGQGKDFVAQRQVLTLLAALISYQANYGLNPVGDQASVIKALTRGNPHQIEFIELPPKVLNQKGEFIDPWGTPYKIIPMPTPDDPLRLGVYSFGKNKKDEHGAKGTDDIATW